MAASDNRRPSGGHTLFRYTAKDIDGRTVRGTMEAADYDALYAQLLEQGLYPQHITGLYSAFLTIYHCPAFSVDHRPYLIPEFMAVIIHLMSGIQCHFDRQTFLFHIHDPEATPGFFCEHDLLGKTAHI